MRYEDRSLEEKCECELRVRHMVAKKALQRRREEARKAPKGYGAMAPVYVVGSLYFLWELGRSLAAQFQFHPGMSWLRWFVREGQPDDVFLMPKILGGCLAITVTWHCLEVVVAKAKKRQSLRQ